MLDDVAIVGLFEGSLFQTDLAGITINEINECLTLAILDVCIKSCKQSSDLVKRRLKYKNKLSVEILNELKAKMNYAELFMAFSTRMILLINKKRDSKEESLLNPISLQLDLLLTHYQGKQNG